MTGCLPNCERAARRLCDADFLSVGRHRQEVGWGPCQAGGALPEVAEAITSRGPVAPPAGVSGPLPGPCGRRGLCLAASVLGSWGEAGPAHGVVAGVVAGGRGRVWPLLLQTCRLSRFLSVAVRQASWGLGAAGRSEPSSHMLGTHSRLPVFQLC